MSLSSPVEKFCDNPGTYSSNKRPLGFVKELKLEHDEYGRFQKIDIVCRNPYDNGQLDEEPSLDVTSNEYTNHDEHIISHNHYYICRLKY